MWVRFTSHLYVRIWLAVVATVMVLIFLVGAAWRLSRDPPQLPIREVLLHNHAGDVIGTAQTKADRQRGDDLEFDILTRDGQTLNILLPRPKPPPGGQPLGAAQFWPYLWLDVDGGGCGGRAGGLPHHAAADAAA